MADLQKIASERKVHCPFYGFHGAKGTFLDSKGNQCPFKTGFAPCYMEMQNQKPDWNKCNFSNNNSLEDFDSFEIRLPGIKYAIAFKDWARQILTNENPYRTYYNTN